MSDHKVYDFITAEGVEGGQRKSFFSDPWLEINSAFQNNRIIQARATGIEKHSLGNKQTEYCLVVRFESGGASVVKGLIPANLSGKFTIKQLRQLVGQYVAFKVVKGGIDRVDNLVILSRIDALEHMQRLQEKDLKVGATKTAVVREVHSIYAMVNIGGFEAFLPDKEIHHGFVSDARELLQRGDTFDVKIKEISNDRITVSLKDLLPDPWDSISEKYNINCEYAGTITGITDYGIFVNLEPGVDALSTLPPHIYNLGVNQRVLIRIRKIIPKNRRIKANYVRRLS